MILVDMNQISLASMMMHLNMNKTTKPDEGMVRHMILNSLRMYRSKFCDEYGELVLCYDSKHYWRRDYYPQYKAGRKKGREESNLDWDAIFTCLNEIKQELKDNFPYKHLEVYGAEADDIIAALCLELEFDNGKTLILSGDKDFIQLQKYTNVTQYSPITKKFVNGIDPNEYKNKLVYLMSVEKARFRKPVMPDCELHLEIEAIRSHGRVWKYKGVAKVKDKKMADAEWSATIVDRNK